MTVKEFLEYRSKLKGESARRVRRRVSEAMDICKIFAYATSSIKNLSAGRRRRVALADALILRPRVLLLDDFLAGRDMTMRENASSVLSAAAAFTAVVVTGHEIADLAGCVTRFLVLKDGLISSSIPVKGLDAHEACALVKKAIEGGGK
jgi:ABC-type multidrug transport system ATPase subunit